MATFSTPDSFKEHAKYIPLLKKALLAVKPDTEKKFLYFKQFPFGPKKLPLVLVDFDPGCPAALAKAGHKPTDEGLVSLTPEGELNFEPKKGNLKRIRLKKYFATMGGGIKPVFVPAGETDDEPEGAESSEAPAPQPATNENESKRRELMARLDELQAKAFPPKIDALKKQVLDKAKSLADANKFAEATLLLDQLAAKAASVPGSAPGTNGFRQQWTAARQSWQDASDALDAQIAQLQQALRKSGDAELVEIAEFGLNGVTGNFKVPLMASIRDIDSAPPEGLKALAQKARGLVAKFAAHIESEERIMACEENPFGVTVSIRSTLKPALAKLEEVLASA
jgi:hypothetical protein